MLTTAEKTTILSALSTVNSVGGGSNENSLLMKLRQEWGLAEDENLCATMSARVLRNFADQLEGG